MGAAVAFADLGDFRATSFPNVSRLEADQFYFEPEISSEHCFEDIVGKSAALRKVLEQVAIVAPRIPPSCFMAKRELARSWSHARFIT